MDLLGLITGFGLAAGAGGRASLVAVLLGLFHYTPYFELNETYAWLASIPVLAVLMVIAAAEILVDSHPDFKEFAHYPTYLTSFLVGFIALSASTGKTDPNLLKLLASGVMGGATATTARYIRNEVTTFIDSIGQSIDDAVGDGTVNTKRSWGENIATVGVASGAIILPWVGLGMILLLIVGGLFYVRKSKQSQ